ncbi:hypothetical protein GCM10010230_24890 [Streptomyces narbonensis]|nr:hypothetical protein GCM10010230_24890 [Streptomyces narbonensis]
MNAPLSHHICITLVEPLRCRCGAKRAEASSPSCRKTPDREPDRTAAPVLAPEGGRRWQEHEGVTAHVRRILSAHVRRVPSAVVVTIPRARGVLRAVVRAGRVRS